jgi:hypothetical protein
LGIGLLSRVGLRNSSFRKATCAPSSKPCGAHFFLGCGLLVALQLSDRQSGNPGFNFRFDPQRSPADLSAAREFPVAHHLPNERVRDRHTVQELVLGDQPRRPARPVGCARSVRHGRIVIAVADVGWCTALNARAARATAAFFARSAAFLAVAACPVGFRVRCEVVVVTSSILHFGSPTDAKKKGPPAHRVRSCGPFSFPPRLQIAGPVHPGRIGLPLPTFCGAGFLITHSSKR